jgi:hypothetical protein
MNNKHTAGPWENCNGDIRAKWETGEEITITNTGATRFCGNESGGPRDKRMTAENKGNAELIAAAPELADALDLCAEYLKESHDEAIEAEFYGCEDKQERHEAEEPNCSYCRAIKQARAALKKAGR